jgi:hypothetical protein
MNYEQQAAGMSGPFTGGAPHAVWCWYPQDSSTAPQITPLRDELVRTFGQLAVQQGAGGSAASSAPAADVRVRYRAAGWAVASWLVTHATAYGISNVRYAGYQWNETAGNRGWTPDPSAPSGSVELR